MVVLKGVPALLSPELLYALARMGHGDEIVLADVNFPTSSICKCGPEELRADGLGIPPLLEAVLQLLPLDTYVESPAAVMELVPSDRKRGLQTPVWGTYQSILSGAGCGGDGSLRKPHPQEGGAGPGCTLDHRAQRRSWMPEPDHRALAPPPPSCTVQGAGRGWGDRRGPGSPDLRQ
ncbi:fucose mutarotase isoform 1-T1 [Lycaon pictus]